MAQRSMGQDRGGHRVGQLRYSSTTEARSDADADADADDGDELSSPSWIKLGAFEIQSSPFLARVRA